jgi:hypothetical protein
LELTELTTPGGVDGYNDAHMEPAREGVWSLGEDWAASERAVIRGYKDGTDIDPLAFVGEAGLFVHGRNTCHDTVEEAVELSIISEHVKVVDTVGPVAWAEPCWVTEPRAVGVHLVRLRYIEVFAVERAGHVLESRYHVLIELVKA